MDAVVQTPAQTVRQGLHIETRSLLPETRKDNPSLIRHAVVIRVAKIEEVGRDNHEDTTVVANDCSGPSQALCVDRSLVVPTVSIGVLK